MRALVSFLSTAVIFLLGCGHHWSDTDTTGSSVPLSFYVVSDDKIEGGQFIDTPDFPKLGYIASAADLVVTRLEAVVPDVSRQQDVMVDKDGKETVMPLQTRPALIIRMRSEDAKKFSTLTKQAVGTRLLLMLGSTPLIAPMVQAPISTTSLTLTLGDNTDGKKVEDELQKLVR
jgi:preprotein translocase subunit SecD